MPTHAKCWPTSASYIEKWLPCFVRDNRAYLTVAIGCTGGRHRSVYFAETLAAHFRGGRNVLVRHRELVGVSSVVPTLHPGCLAHERE